MQRNWGFIIVILDIRQQCNVALSYIYGKLALNLLTKGTINLLNNLTDESHCHIMAIYPSMMLVNVHGLPETLIVDSTLDVSKSLRSTKASQRPSIWELLIITSA